MCTLACARINLWLHYVRDASTWGDGTCLWTVDTGKKIPAPHALGIAILPHTRGFAKKKKKKNKFGGGGNEDTELKTLRLRIILGLRGNAVHEYFEIEGRILTESYSF